MATEIVRMSTVAEYVFSFILLDLLRPRVEVGDVLLRLWRRHRAPDALAAVPPRRRPLPGEVRWGDGPEAMDVK